MATGLECRRPAVEQEKRQMHHDNEHGRVTNPPAPWQRSEKDNLFVKTDRYCATIFKFASTNQFGIFAVVFGDKPQYERDRFPDEWAALEAANEIIWDLENNMS